MPMPHAQPAAPGSTSPLAGELIFWRIANPAMAVFIGFVLIGAEGAFLGLLLGVALISAPDVFRRLPGWTRALMRTLKPALDAAYAALPPSIRSILQVGGANELRS